MLIKTEPACFKNVRMIKHNNKSSLSLKAQVKPNEPKSVFKFVYHSKLSQVKK